VLKARNKQPFFFYGQRVVAVDDEGVQSAGPSCEWPGAEWNAVERGMAPNHKSKKGL